MHQILRHGTKRLAGLAVAVLLSAGGAAWADDGLIIESAEWRPEKKVLLIEGTADTPDSTVLLRDAETDTLLGAAAVRADGKWRLKIRRPKLVPERMQVECDGAVRECPVSGAVAAR